MPVNNAASKGLTLSIIVGTLLVPLSALGALWLTSQPAGAADSTSTTTSPPDVSTESTVATTVSAADIQAACGSEGMALVTLEEEDKITDVQQAALDALRDVCEQEGMPLPTPAPAEAIVRTVIVPAPSSASTSAAQSSNSYDDDEHEGDEHEDEREEHDHEDEHEEHEHEGEHED